MNNLISKLSLLQLCFFLVLSVVGIQSSWATRCLEGQKATSTFNISTATNTTHTTSVTPIQVTSSNQSAGSLLWQSPVYSTTLTCYDDYATNSTEKAYLYLDDATKSLATAFRSTNLIIGINFNGTEYPIDSLTENKINTGFTAINKQTNSSTAKSNCTLIGRTSGSCSDPQTITISYSLYIKSRGSGSNFTSSAQTYQVFQLDGEGGRNANGNFQEKVSNVNVTYIECITSLNTQNVDLGSYYSYQDTNTILRRTPFTINVTTTGKDCAKYPFLGKFTSTQRYDSTTLTATETGMKNVVGIKIYPQGETQEIPLDTNFDFGSSNGSTLSKNFEAGVLFFSKPAVAGTFSSTLNYEVYFK
ncbi:hypothetical protein IAE19_01630 [Acinetobacter sp. S40]|uniref:hypothetical protein n=1 Tax=Acinetobacter sp. S40 TaxID=2767434 RepID=UPI0019093E17|nr:hypothetical protein [Acinetobacter sp. S40]MBJ9984141.1 hypothetical protein [Acinetobacter sp. S40]